MDNNGFTSICVHCRRRRLRRHDTDALPLSRRVLVEIPVPFEKDETIALTGRVATEFGSSRVRQRMWVSARVVAVVVVAAEGLVSDAEDMASGHGEVTPTQGGGMLPLLGGVKCQRAAGVFFFGQCLHTLLSKV